MVDTGGTQWHQSNRGVSIYIAIYLSLFVLVVVLSKALHDRPRLASVLPEAAMVILVGITAGFFINLFVDDDDDDVMMDDVALSVLSFSPTAFFVVLLPPIIFNSGYHLQRDLFFRYVTPICLYACVGTFVCTMVVAALLYVAMPLFSFKATLLELMAFGALISATDPVSTLAVFSAKKVDPQLFYLVFGESVINDAVGLVLFEALAHLVEYEHAAESNNEAVDVGQEVGQFFFDFFVGFCGSLVVGTLFGLAVAYFLKKVDLRKTSLLELCLYVTIMYFPFVVAEMLHLSGIVTVLFTGIAAQRYAQPNLTPSTANHADAVFRLVAHLTETVIFLELGLSVFGLSKQDFHIGFLACALAACFVGRAANIYPITLIFNLSRRGVTASTPTNKKLPLIGDVGAAEDGLLRTSSSTESISDTTIPLKTAHMLWFSGLRGAVSYALVRTFPQTGNQGVFIGTTMFIVLITTFLLGGGTTAALGYLGIRVNVDETEYLKTVERRQFLSGWIHRFEAERIRTWVIRDYEKKANNNLENHNGTGTGEANNDVLPVPPTGLDSKLQDDNNIMDYQPYHQEEHIELTEMEHLTNVKKTTSVYDYGQ